jgi:hypothetical protein
MSSRSLSLVSWLSDRVLAFLFAYIMLKGARKITRHQESDHGDEPNYFGLPVRRRNRAS